MLEVVVCERLRKLSGRPKTVRRKLLQSPRKRRSMLWGTVPRTVVIGGASEVRILTSTAWAVDAKNGGSPESIS